VFHFRPQPLGHCAGARSYDNMNILAEFHHDSLNYSYDLEGLGRYYKA